MDGPASLPILTLRAMSRPVSLRLLPLGLVCAALLCAGAAAPTGESGLPAELQAQLLVKILSFDRNLGVRPEGELVVGILVQRKFRPSLDAASEMFDALSVLGRVELLGARVRPQYVEVDAAEELELALAAAQVDVLYVSPLRAMTVPQITRVSRPLGLHTITSVTRYVDEGLAVGLGMRDERPEIVISRSAAEGEGADFASSLLRIARVVP